MGLSSVLVPVCADDEPKDGPQHYILLLGFYQPLLIGELDAIGVNVSSVIKLCSEQPPGARQERQTPEGDEPSELSKDEDDLKWVTKARMLDLFWSGLRPVLDSRPLDSRLHDMVELSYTLPKPPSPTELPDTEVSPPSPGASCSSVWGAFVSSPPESLSVWACPAGEGHADL